MPLLPWPGGQETIENPRKHITLNKVGYEGVISSGRMWIDLLIRSVRRIFNQTFQEHFFLYFNLKQNPLLKNNVRQKFWRKL